MTKTRCITLGKSERNSINEDAVIARKNVIAVSDGAGGGGLFADRWSRYLLQRLPKSPIMSAEELDEWIASIWEPFYNRAEETAKHIGGMALDKFYDEGSFATLAAVWKTPNGMCRWMSYGDSVVFHYDYCSGVLTHSFSSLSDFNNPPFLINCKDELKLSGFRSGEFKLTRNPIVFVATDALSHYVMMMYELSKQERHSPELELALQANTKNANLIKNGMTLPFSKFEKEVIAKLRKSAYDSNYCKNWLEGLCKSGLLAYDDYSFAVMYE